MSEDWMSARDALELLWPGCNSFSPSTAEAICQNAAAGRVRAMAENFTLTGQGQTLRSENFLIPRRFWQVTLDKQDWHHGIFISVERGTDLNMGIDWEIRCEALRVTFERAGIEAMKGNEGLPASPSSGPMSIAKSKRGRPKASGGFIAQDALLVEKMREYIINHRGTTPHFAAGQFNEKADGSGSLEAKQKRLATRYRKAYRT